MRLRLVAFVLASTALAASPALAQDPRAARLEERYGVAGWPASAPARLGLDPATVEFAGWTQLALERDARRAEARASYGPAGGAARVQLVLRRYDTPRAARQGLLEGLGVVQATLAPRQGLGDLAFATPGAKPDLVLGTWGNLGFTLRALEAGVHVTPLLPALDAALRETAPAADPELVVLPRALGVEELEAAPGGPVRFALVLDPAAPAPAALHFACTQDASVLSTAEGYALYPAGPGAVEVTVSLLSADLRRGELRVQLVAR
ncbi:MAG: hypothetical protein R3F62_23420 [Planctomycetota bacterium]